MPAPLEEKCLKEIETLEEEMKVQYVTSFERIYEKRAIEKGIEQGIGLGIQKGEIALLLRLLELKFKKIPDFYRQKIEEADAETLLAWGERMLSSTDIKEVFKN